MNLKIKNITKKFNEVVVLNKINLSLSSGRIYGFIGRNGCGKSVLLKIICGFYTPTEGEILLDGVNYIKRNEFLPNARALIEKPCFLPDLSGYENLKLLASIQNKISESEILGTLKRLNLNDEKDKLYSKYSLGTKQKLGIAQVLMEDPDILILDEPLNGIEKVTADKVRKILLEEKKKGKIIILASHIKEDIELLADEVYEIDAGKINKISK